MKCWQVGRICGEILHRRGETYGVNEIRPGEFLSCVERDPRREISKQTVLRFPRNRTKTQDLELHRQIIAAVFDVGVDAFCEGRANAVSFAAVSRPLGSRIA